MKKPYVTEIRSNSRKTRILYKWNFLYPRDKKAKGIRFICSILPHPTWVNSETIRYIFQQMRMTMALGSSFDLCLTVISVINIFNILDCLSEGIRWHNLGLFFFLWYNTFFKNNFIESHRKLQLIWSPSTTHSTGIVTSNKLSNNY